MFHLYFLVRYSRLLEEHEFQSQKSSFLLFLLFGVTFMLLFAPFINLNFLGSSLTFMMLYVWGRRNRHVQMQMFGIVNFRAPYLPYVMLLISTMLGNSPVVDLLGIAAGHCFYFGKFVYPKVANARGWRNKEIMQPPEFLAWLCGDLDG